MTLKKNNILICVGARDNDILKDGGFYIATSDQTKSFGYDYIDVVDTDGRNISCHASRFNKLDLGGKTMINKTRLNDGIILRYLAKYIESGRTSFTCPLGDILINQSEDDFIVTMTDKYYGRLD